MLNWTKTITETARLSSSQFSTAIKNIFSRGKIDTNLLEKFKEFLIVSDFGFNTSLKLIKIIEQSQIKNSTSESQVRQILYDEIVRMLSISDHHFKIDKSKLNVILFVGVNGAGKTTTIGKLAHKYSREGYKVTIAACDTFRAGAVEQIDIWAQKSNVNIIKGSQGLDPAAVAYKAMEATTKDGTEILLIDTAGRLQNDKNLMNELTKICKVIAKLDESAPHYTLLVLDSNNGQNVISQSKHFLSAAAINGIIATKLDGTAKAGSIASIVDSLKLPIYFAATGEKNEDIEEFSPTKYARSLLLED